MNKLMNTFLLMMIPLITFAQEERPARESRNADQFDSHTFPGGAGPSEVSTVDGGVLVPIDDYAFFLIGVAVLIIAYVMYRRNQLSKA